MLRRVEGGRATVWVETGASGHRSRSRAGDATGTARTFSAHGHHYGFVVVDGLPPDRSTPYEVFLDGREGLAAAGVQVPAAG